MKAIRLNVPASTYTTEYDVGALSHLHAQWEIVLFPSENFTNYVNDVALAPKANTVLVLGPMHRHAIVQKRAGSKHRDIYIAEKDLSDLLRLFDERLQERIRRENDPLFFSVSAQIMQNVLEELTTVESLQSIDQSSAVLKEFVHSIIAYLFGQAIKEEYFSQNATPKSVLDFLNLLQIPENLQKTLPELVANSGYSYSYFSVLFQKYTGFTLRNYFLQARMKRACYLLTAGNVSVLEIAYDIGYDSVSAFIAKFKEFYNCTPFAYRKKHVVPAKAIAGK